MRVVFFVMTAMAIACAEPADNEDPESVSLVSVNGWTTVEADDDPLAIHRHAGIVCGDEGVIVENGVLEIDTGRCPYFSARQGTLLFLDVDDWVAVTIYHDDLYADPPGVGHVALLLGEDLLWERTISIPARASVFTEHIKLSRAYPQNTRVDFHLHNHGLNHWRLMGIERSTGP